MVSPRYTSEQLALADSVKSTIERWEKVSGPRTSGPTELKALWRTLGDLGLWEVGTAAGLGGMAEVAIASRELGRMLVRGPVAETFFAVRALPSELAVDVAAGSRIPTTGERELMPWADLADVVIVRDGDETWQVRDTELVPRLDICPGEWATCRGGSLVALTPPATAGIAHDISMTAYLIGIGRCVFDLAVQHAQIRKQFGRSIGDFQAVAHQLVDVGLGLQAADASLAAAARECDADCVGGQSAVARATLSAVGAAKQALATAHQVFGAVGYTLEGPVATATLMVRQLIALRMDVNSVRQQVVSTLDLGVRND